MLNAGRFWGRLQVTVAVVRLISLKDVRKPLFCPPNALTVTILDYGDSQKLETKNIILSVAESQNINIDKSYLSLINSWMRSPIFANKSASLASNHSICG
jgi:hypothetical protein